MSEPIPESIPTSLSHPSSRASKKLRPNPFSSSSTTTRISSSSSATALLAQATQISALMSHPDLPLTLPPSSSTTTTSKGHSPATTNSYTPPEIVANVQGSSAGAGSGEFHVYKASRRREYERIRGMEAEAKREQEDEEWERREAERRASDEREREKKKKKRREKKKKKQQQQQQQQQKNKMKGGKEGTETGEEGGGQIEEKMVKTGVGGLQIPTRLGGEGDEEGMNANADEAEGLGNGVQAQTAAPEENGLVLHDDDE